MGLVLSGVFLFLAGHQAMYPYMTETHAFLSSSVPSSHIILLHFISSCGLLTAAGYVLRMGDVLFVISATLSLLPAIYWSYVFSSFLSYPVHILWLPATNPTMAALTWYVKKGCEQLDADVSELRSYMYPAKGV